MKPIIGISMGDPAGIGAEITVKALCGYSLQDVCVPVVIGDLVAMQDAARFTNCGSTFRIIDAPHEAKGDPACIDLIDMAFFRDKAWAYKAVSAECGDAAYRYVEKATRLAMVGGLHAIVTGPINKESIHLAGHHFAGHTEILAHLTGAKNCAMLLISDSLRVIHVTTHVSMRQACDLITERRVYNVIKLAQQALTLLGIPEGRIGVAGLNAHSSENGLFGNEEEQAIIPAIQRAAAEGLSVEGPVPPDTVFVKAMARQYDIVVAMYHDQGHIPLKLSGFKLDLKTNRYTSMSGVNCTIGLPIIRTSVDHGTAFGKAGEGRANEESMVDAIRTAVTMANSKFHL